jgi:hypothetical protein
VIVPNDVFTQAVIQQHHERQDGTGYPRGLTGSNRLRRPRGSERSQGAVSLEGEIAALIDLYTAVTSHRPYRQALAPDAGVREVPGQEGSALNTELTKLFGRSIAWYPVLSRVRVLSGDCEGCSGYVLSAGAERPWRPTIRLLEGPDGLSMPPLDFDRTVESMDIAGVPPPEPTSYEAGRWALADEVERIVDSRPVEGVEIGVGAAPDE